MEHQTTTTTTDDDPTIETRRWKRIKTLLAGRMLGVSIVLYICLWLLLVRVPIFDYSRCCMPITVEEAEMRCRTTNITLSSSVREGAFHYSDIASMRTLLAVTSIRRTVECVFRNQHTDDPNDDKKRRFVYQKDYLNITQIDVASILNKDRAQYPLDEDFILWYYDEGGRCSDALRIRGEVDENCLSTTAIDRDAYYSSGIQLLLTMALHLTILTIILFLYVVFFAFYNIWRDYRRVQQSTASTAATTVL